MDNTLNEIVRGNDARRILEDALYTESFEKVRENLVGTMARSALGDVETHHRLVIALQVLDQIKKALEEVMQTGQMAELQIKDKRKFFG